MEDSESDRKSRSTAAYVLHFPVSIYTTPEEFGNEIFTLATHQMFSVNTTGEDFKKARITGHLKENSFRELGPGLNIKPNLTPVWVDPNN